MVYVIVFLVMVMRGVAWILGVIFGGIGIIVTLPWIIASAMRPRGRPNPPPPA